MPPVILDNEHLLHTLGGAGGLVGNLRSQILANGLSAVVTFCRGVRTAATRVDGDPQEIGQEEFRAAASRAGAGLTVRFCRVSRTRMKPLVSSWKGVRLRLQTLAKERTSVRYK